jgi:probable HAF family extracellular repeat protein
MRFVFAAIAAALIVPALGQPQYEVIDLTAKFGQFFVPVDINNNGVIVAGSGEGACVVENGVLTLLPKYKGHFWAPTEIADNGDILGHSTLFTGVEHTLLYRNGTVIDIGVTGTANGAAGQGLNNLGQIAGGTGQNAFIWDAGKTTFLPAPARAFALGLNDAGTAVGVTISPSVEVRAAQWVNGVFDDLAPAWATDSEATEVNEKGEAVGWAIANQGGYRAVLWRDGKAIDLGDLGGGSRGRDVNNASQVVGEAIGHGPTEGILWDNGTLYRLEDLVPGGTGYQLINHAYAINDSGQIVTSGFTGSANPYLLFNPVPETSSATTIVIGLLMVCAMRRFSR